MASHFAKTAILPVARCVSEWCAGHALAGSVPGVVGGGAGVMVVVPGSGVLGAVPGTGYWLLGHH